MASLPKGQPPTLRRPAVFLDRDGVLNEDSGYTFEVAKLRLISGAAWALKLLKQRGFLLIVVSNQSGVARGLFSTQQVDAFNHALDQRLREEHGTGIDAFYYCPYHPEGTVASFTKASSWRKPEPGMVLQAQSDYGIELEGSYLVGDRYDDIECAVRAGVKGIQVLAPGQIKHPLALSWVSSLAEAPALIPAP